VLTVVLYETALGGLALLWLAPLWGVVRPGFFKLAGGTALACAVLAWLAGRGELADAGATGRMAALWLGVFAAAVLVWQVLLYARVPAARWWRDGHGPARAGRRLAARAAAAGPARSAGPCSPGLCSSARPWTGCCSGTGTWSTGGSPTGPSRRWPPG
jgi:hypothetical protein